MGAAAALVPAFIPASSLRFGLTDYSLLAAVPLLFGGLFTGVCMAPLAGLKLRFDSVIRLGAAILAIGLVGIFISLEPQVFLFAAATLGFGFGLLEVSIIAAVKRFAKDAARDLTKLNLAFALSAMVAPLVLLLELNMFQSAYLLPTVATMALGASALLTQMQGPQGRLGLARVPRLWPLLVAATAYVGAESVLAGWSSTLTGSLLDLSAEHAAIGASGFWALIALGRSASLAITPRFMSTPTSLSLWAGLGGLALILAAVFQQEILTLALFAFAVFAAGPIYGLLIGRVLELVQPADASGTTAAIIVVGAAGGFLIPGLVQFNPGVTQAALGAGLSLVFVLLMSVSSRRNEPIRSKEIFA